MRSVRTLAAVALSFFAASNVAAPAAEPKNGGILKVYHRDSPGSASIHEGATYSLNVPFDRSGSRRKLGLERRQQDLDLQASAGRQMA